MQSFTKIALGPAGLLLLALLLRLPSLWIPVIDVDETQFVGFAQVLRDGGNPYLDSLDTKPPLIYAWTVAALSLVKLEPLRALHVATIIWVWLTGLALGYLGGLLGDRCVGRMAGLLYVAFSAGFVPKWISTSITQIMNLPIILAMIFLFLAAHRDISKAKMIGFCLLSGLCASLAFNFKYQGGIVLPIAVLALIPLYAPDRRWRRAAFAALGLCLGFGVGVGLVWGVLVGLGVWGDFWQWSVLGSFHYISLDRNPVLPLLVTHVGGFVLAMSPLFLLAKRGKSDGNLVMPTSRAILWIWFAFTLIPVSTGGRFYHHYFLQLLPPLAVLAAFGVVSLCEAGKWRRSMTAFLIAPVLIPVFSRFFFTPLQHALGEETFEVHAAVGEALKDMSAGGPVPPYLFVWGFATPIYTYSGLKPASRFLWTDLLSGRFPGPRTEQERGRSRGLPVAWKAFWTDMEKRPPRFFVDTAPAGIHDYGLYPVSAYPDLKRWLDDGFIPCREVARVVIYCAKRPY